MSARYKVAWLCEALLVSRSGYYDWKKRRSKLGPREVENTRLREQIREQFTRSRQTYGSPRIACPGLPRKTQPHRTAHAQGATLRSATLQVSRPATTDSRHGGPIA